MGIFNMFGLKTSKDIVKELADEGYKIDKVFDGWGKCLMLCLERRVLIITPNTCKVSNKSRDFISFDNIVGAELVIDSKQISSSNRLSRAVVGGVLLGGIGAVIGGLSGSSKIDNEFENVDVLIKLNDVLNPIYTFPVNKLKYRYDEGEYILQTAKEAYETILRIANN